MLNPNGFIFIVSIPAIHDGTVSRSDLKTYHLPTDDEYNEIFHDLKLQIIDKSLIQSDLGVAFNDGKIKAILRLVLFMTGLKKTITIIVKIAK